jgi:glycosyltransferase involved in cell wall biosynthesis
MNISVVIPVFNAEKTIGQCLDSLYGQSVKPLEIIVVDNNSTDGTKDIVLNMFYCHKEIPAYYLAEVRQGPSHARNSGANRAGGDVIGFIDADCIADPSWLYRLSESFNSSDIGAVAGSIIGFDKKTTIGKFHAMFTMKGLPQSQMFYEFNLVSGGFPTANFSIRKGLFKSLNGFDESIPIYAEDYDLCARIYKSGSNIYYNKDVIVFHQHRQNLASTWSQSYGFGTGHATLLKKHFPRLLVLELPKWRFISRNWPLRAWIDIASADKKIIIGLILSVIWWPFIFLTLSYLIFLYRDIGLRIIENHLEASFFEKWCMIFLLCFKSMAMTAGRLRGSFTHGVLCF